MDWELKLLVFGVGLTALCIAFASFMRSERAGSKPFIGVVAVLLCIGCITVLRLFG